MFVLGRVGRPVLPRGLKIPKAVHRDLLQVPEPLLAAPGQEPRSSRLSYSRSVSQPRFRARAYSMNFRTASSMSGISGLTTPISPPASQSRIRFWLASQDVRSSDRRRYSPRREPWTRRTQSHFWLRASRRSLPACFQVAA